VALFTLSFHYICIIKRIMIGNKSFEDVAKFRLFGNDSNTSELQ
jgi:hypothetical protein